MRRKIVTVMPVTAVLAVGLFARRTLHPVASRRPDDVRQHDVDSEEAAAAGFEEEHEPVMVLVAFVPRLRDVGGADEGGVRPDCSPLVAVTGPDPATATTARSATPHTPGANHWERPGDSSTATPGGTWTSRSVEVMTTRLALSVATQPTSLAFPVGVDRHGHTHPGPDSSPGVINLLLTPSDP